MSRPTPFVHLHVHTEYSLLDGANRIEPLVSRAAELGMPALAMTDHGVMFGTVPFYKACRGHGIKPILGCELYVAPGSRHRKEGGERPYHLTVLAENEEGYRNLLKLVSFGYTEGFYYKPRVDLELLNRYRKGLIVLSGCMSGEVASKFLQGRREEARQAIGRYREIFGPDHYFLELQDHGLPEQPALNQWLLEQGLPVVATNDVHYLTPVDARVQDILVCIGTGKTVSDPDRLRMPTNELYLKSGEEMYYRFGHIPGALENTLAIAERCNVELSFGKIHLPTYTLPPGYDEASYLRHLCEERLGPRYGGHPPAGARERLEHELSVIESMGFPGYFLIVWDFVEYARSRGIPVGPGRGSGASSLVAYVLGITDIDPLRYGLLFERFLNPERVDMPDLDIDFCDERRGEVIDYVHRKYGADCVAQVITFATLGARAAVRDVGRAMGMSYGEVDRIAKLIPWGRDLNTALQEVPALMEQYQTRPEIRDLLDTARAVEGMPRNPSIHAAGVVITADPLVEHVPLYKTADDNIVTQFDMDQLKEIGLLKMDFLGLRTLTVTDHAVRAIRQREPSFDLARIPMDDPETFAMLARGETLGVFQLEAGWVADVLRQMKPTCFEDIIATISLCRPGPMEHIPDYIRGKHHPETVQYLHPDLEPILSETYGVMVYQEQIILIAHRLAGMSLGQADLLRRAVAKKKREDLEKYGRLFMDRLLQRGYAPEVARALYDQILRFARYGFNKCHATPYAKVAYQTAYLKRHYPVEFMAALINTVVGDERKVAVYLEECRRLGITVLLPDVNTSDVRFTPDGSRIRFGLVAVKNLGQGAAEAIVRARNEGGPFTSLQDFCERVDMRYLSRKALESLVKAGAFDRVRRPDGRVARRSQLLEVLDQVMQNAQQVQRHRQTGQISLFDLGVVPGAGPEPEPLPDIPEFPLVQLLAMEHEVLGFYVSGHPVRQYQEALDARGCQPVAALAEQRDGARVAVGGLVTALKRVSTRSGGSMAFLTLEDQTGQVEVVLFPRVLSFATPYLARDRVVVVRGRLQNQEEELKVLADEVLPVRAPAGETSGRTFAAEGPSPTQMPYQAPDGPAAPTPGSTPVEAPAHSTVPPQSSVRSSAHTHRDPILYLKADAADERDPVMRRIHQLLTQHPGSVRVRIKLERSGRWIEVHPHLRVTVSKELLDALVNLLGADAVVMRR